MAKGPSGSGGEAEEWRSVMGFETLYEVSNLGRIRSLARVTRHGRTRIGKALSICEKSRYRYVVLSNNTKTTKRISILVCTAFNGPKPSALHEVNHEDGDKHNDRASNLEWATKARNQQHACETKLRPLGEQSYQSKLTNDQVREIRRLYSAGGITGKALGAQFSVSKSAIEKILTRKNWKYIK